MKVQTKTDAPAPCLNADFAPPPDSQNRPFAYVMDRITRVKGTYYSCATPTSFTPMSASSSSYWDSEHMSCCSQTQSESMNDAAHGIANHTWQFPPLEVARMLSPEGPKHCLDPAGKLLLLDHYDCMVDELAFQNALGDVVTRLENDRILALEHRDLAGFLNRCIEICHDAPDKQSNALLCQDRWYQDLQFALRTAMDDHPTSLQPPVAGGHGFSAGGNEVPYWDPLGGKPTDQPTLPVEVGTSWKNIVSCACEDTCHLFNASGTQLFSVVLGFNRDEKTLRFLIYHHGGFTASWPCNITQPEGLREIGRLFLALVSWRTPGDAGFIPSYTSSTYVLPADQSGESYTLAAADSVLSRPPHIRGRMTTVSRLCILQHSSSMEGGSSHDQHSNSIPAPRRQDGHYLS